MVFSSVEFCFYFLPLFLIFYYGTGCSNLALTLFSLIFYAWGEPRFVPVLLAYILLNYCFGLAIDRGTIYRRLWLTTALCGNLGLLFYFKYFNFFAAQVDAVAGWLGRQPHPFSPILLPLGVSFIAFQGVSYVVDVYRRDVPAQRSLLAFAAYKSAFPQLIAGPIVRYREIAADIGRRRVDLDSLFTGARRFVLGLAQKVLIANILAQPADQVFAAPTAELGAVTAWLGIACYTLQIYFDFAGYSNMAIGLGEMLGFRYPINFDRPYASQSVTEFWRRWHITLSRWFRDYLYIPLGGNRRSPSRTYANLAIVFLLCGLWHGANWTFVAWGAYHGAFLVLERLGIGTILLRLPAVLRHVYLVLVVMVGWTLFRSAALPQAGGMLRAMAGGGEGSLLWPPERFLTHGVVLALVAGAFFAVAPVDRWLRATGQRLEGSTAGLVAGTTAGVVLLALAVLSLLDIAAGAYNPFIYYRF